MKSTFVLDVIIYIFKADCNLMRLKKKKFTINEIFKGVTHILFGHYLNQSGVHLM